jgi:hypothetical protein
MVGYGVRGNRKLIVVRVYLVIALCLGLPRYCTFGSAYIGQLAPVMLPSTSYHPFLYEDTLQVCLPQSTACPPPACSNTHDNAAPGS